jgi:RNA polymerase sigma-70 factor (ECF subfamily)
VDASGRVPLAQCPAGIVESAGSFEGGLRRSSEPVAIERGLVVRAGAGDAGAFRALFERHAPSVRRFLRDLLGDDEAADEGTQETFVRAHRRMASLRETDRVLPWLFGIARNVSHEQVRARRHPLRGAGDEGLLAQPDVGPTPEGALMGREADRLLAAALAELSEERRAALVMRIDHGLDYDEIAAVMRWSLQKVKNEIHRGRLVLRSRLERYVGGKE